MLMMCALWVIRSTTAFASRGSGSTPSPPAERQSVRGHDQAAELVAFDNDLEDELAAPAGRFR